MKCKLEINSYTFNGRFVWNLCRFPSAALECDEFRRLFDVSEKDDGSASNETEQKVNDPRAQLLAAKELCTALFEVKSDVLFRNGIVDSKPSSFGQLIANLRK